METDSRRLLQAVRNTGVEDRHIATDNLNVSLRYYPNDYMTSISAYVVSRTYAATLKDPAKLEPFIDTILQNGANQLTDVQFYNTEMRKHRDKARQLAIKAAKEKATALAEAVDCRIGQPRTIGETSSYWSPSRSSQFRGHMFQNVVQEAPVETPAPEGETMPLGQIGIKATVSATFDLEPLPAALASHP